jgi:hypothetical protein
MAVPDFSKPQGYHRLASLMSIDTSIAIFRRFDEINMLNLLSLQAEIFELQTNFRLECYLDDTSDDPSKRDFLTYFLRPHQSKEKSGEQYSMLLTLRDKMKIYSKSLHVKCHSLICLKQLTFGDDLLLQGV